MENSKTEQKITGNLGNYEGKTHDYKYFPESQKSTISFTIRTPDTSKAEGQWVHVRAYSSKAERLKKAIEEDKIKTFSLTGNYKTVEYESKNTGKPVKFEELQVNNIILHKTLEISGKIAKIEEKQTPNGKAFKEILVIDEKVVPGKGAHKDLYNVTIWPEKEKFIPKDFELKTGADIAVKGRANILENQTGSAQYTTIEARNIDKTPAKLKEQIKELQAKAAAKDQGQDKAASKTKAKGKGQEMER